MIDFSGRATRAGTRGVAVAAAVSCFTVAPLAYHRPAHADGPVGPANRYEQRAAIADQAPHGGHGAKGRGHERRPEDRRAGGWVQDRLRDRPAGRSTDRLHGRALSPDQARDQARDPALERGREQVPGQDRGRVPAPGRGREPAPGLDRGRGPAPGLARGREQGIPRARVVFDAPAPRGPILPGGTYQWPYTVTNTGTAPARDVALATRPDKNLKVAATPPKCKWTAHDNLVCRIGIIPGGQTRKGVLTGTVAKDAPAGRPLSNPAKLSWDGRPAPEARYMSFPSAQVASPPRSPERSSGLAVRDAVGPARPGGDIPYEVSVTNRGPVTAEAVVVRASVADAALPLPCALTAPIKNLAGTVTSLTSALSPCGGQGRAGAVPACGSVPFGTNGRPAVLPCLTGQGAAAGVPAPVPPCAYPNNPGVRPVVPPCAAAQEVTPVVPPCAAQATVPPGAAPPCANPMAASLPPAAGHVPDAPAGDAPALIGGGRHHCVAQGAGFVCPVGAIAPGGTRTLKLALHPRTPAHPPAIRCLSAAAAGAPDRDPGNGATACDTHAGRPIVPHQNLALHRLPRTGLPFGLLGMCGAGLAGVGFVLFRLGRARRGGEHAIR